MDNLYNSAKFFKNAWNHPKFVMVFVAMGGFICEIPSCVMKYECMKQIYTSWSQGTVKAAVLKNDSEFKGLVYVTVYDNKPVHLLSMIEDSLEWGK